MSQSVSRSVRILKALAEQPRGLRYLSELLGVHRSTVSRILQTLEAELFVLRNESGEYRPGPALIAVAQAGLEQIDARRVAQPQLDKLSALCGQTVHLAALQGGELIYIDKREGNTNVRLYSRLGRSVPWYCTGVGKAVLANLPGERQDAIIEDIQFVKYTANTIANEAALREELGDIRLAGYAVDNFEHEPLVACIAAPVTGPDGSAYGAISITSPVLNPDELSNWLAELRAAAAVISRGIGWHDVAT